MYIEYIILHGCDKCGKNKYLMLSNCLCHPCLIDYFERSTREAIPDYIDEATRPYLEEFKRRDKKRLHLLKLELSTMTAERLERRWRTFYPTQPIH